MWVHWKKNEICKNYMYITGTILTYQTVKTRTGGYDSDPYYTNIPDKDKPLTKTFCIYIQNNQHITHIIIEKIKKWVRHTKYDRFINLKTIDDLQFYDDIDAYDITSDNIDEPQDYFFTMQV